MIVASARGEGGIERPRRDAAPEVLDPLGLEAVTTIVGPARAPDLFARSGGNPLFLAELAAWETEHGSTADLPESIRRSVEERVARAGKAAPTLRTAAVIGPDVDLDVLSGVTGLPRRPAAGRTPQPPRTSGCGAASWSSADRARVCPRLGMREALALHRGAPRTGIHPSARPPGCSRHVRRWPEPLAVARHARPRRRSRRGRRSADGRPHASPSAASTPGARRCGCSVTPSPSTTPAKARVERGTRPDDAQPQRAGGR